MKKRIIALTLCVLLCALSCVVTGCDEKAKTDATTKTPTPIFQTFSYPKHDHLYEVGTCKVCGQRLYELVYTSNGDGTCYVSDVKITTKQPFTLSIPEVSPAGDRVTAVKCEPFANSIPKIIAKEDFEQILERLRGKVIAGEISEFYYVKFQAFFTLRALSEAKTEKAKEHLLLKYPITEITDIYEYATDTSLVEDCGIASILYKYAQYGDEEMLRDYANLYDLIEDSTLKNKEEIIATLPKVTEQRGTLITSVEFPSTIEELEIVWYVSCANLTSVVLPDSVTEIPERAFGNHWGVETMYIPKGVTKIGDGAIPFKRLKALFYGGTAEEWSQLNNEPTEVNTVYFYSEAKPQAKGNYWHYVDGVHTVWK